MKLRDGLALCWRETAIEAVAAVGHVEQKLRRREPLAAGLGEIVAQLDKVLHAHAVDIRNRAPGEWRKTEAENRTDIGLAHVSDDLLLDTTRGFQRLDPEQPAL